MNHKWTKEIVYELNAALKEKSVIWYNGVMFIQLRPTDEDFVLQYFKTLVVNLVGASAWTMHRTGFQHPKDQGHTSGILEFILTRIKEDVPYFPAIILTEDVLVSTSRINLDFSIAHELAHVVHCDIAIGNEVVQGSPEYHERELRADKFACELLGVKSGAVDTLEYVVDLVENVDPVARNIPLDLFKLAKEQLHSRLDTLYEMEI